MGSKKRFIDVLTIGFALFAIFFGAGNLMFPPYLGLLSGGNWFKSMFGFLSTDPVVPIVGLIVTATIGGEGDSLGKRVHPLFSKILAAICMIICGPIFAVPRTAATTHEIFVMQFFPDAPTAITSFIYFGITIYLAINPGKVLDIVGKFLTPALLIILTVIIVRSIAVPLGPIGPSSLDNEFLTGFTEGYQTMDGLVSSLLAGLVFSDIASRGYKDKKETFKMAVCASVVALVLLMYVYGGLTYVGATVGSYFSPDTERVPLLMGLVELMFGTVGLRLLGIAMTLACLTTSVGITSTFGNYFEKISEGKLKYKYLVIFSAIISFFISQFGVSKIIVLAVPVLSLVYPFVIGMIILSIFDKKIKFNATYIGFAVGIAPVAIISCLASTPLKENEVIASLGSAISNLPLGNVGMAWFVPALIGMIIFTIIAYGTNKTPVAAEQ